jgi:hypothetical protein
MKADGSPCAGRLRATAVRAGVVALALLASRAMATPAAGAIGGARAWQAEWIWDGPLAAERNAYTYFRRDFTLPARPSSAPAFITADSRYLLYVNGRYVGRGPVRSSPGIQSYDTYDLAPFLAAGANVVAVLVHFFGEGNEQYVLGRGALLFETAIETGAAPVLIKSDATWRVSRSAAWNTAAPRENDSNGFVEIYDARLEPVGWAHPGFAASGWGEPFVIGRPPRPPWLTLVPRDIPFLAEREIRPTAVLQVGEVARLPGADPLLVAPQVQAEPLAPPTTVAVTNADYLVSSEGAATTVTTPAAGRDAAIVVDMGRVISGFPFITVDGPAGAVIDVAFSEWVHDQRVVAVKSPVRFDGFEGRPMYTADRVTLRQGPFRWQRFSFSGFRYLQLTVRGATRPVRILSAGAVFTSYPFTARGRYRSSDELLNRIWNVGAYTTLVSTYDVFMDCPWREKGQWIDLATPLASYNAFGDQAIASRYLRTTAQSQDADGRMFFPYPSWFSFELPDQTMWWGMHLWQHYLHFGDLELVAELYPALARANDWFQRNLSPRGLLMAAWPHALPRLLWPWIDHGHRPGANVPGQKLGEMAALDALYYKFLIDAANLARAVGRSADASAFEAQAAKLKTSFQEAYWDPERGFYWDDVARTIKGEQASVLAVLYGLAPAEHWTRILDNVMDADLWVGHSGPHFYFFVLDALAKAGLYDRALETVRRRWGELLAQGATTWWEGWTLDVDFFGRPWPPGEHHNLSLAHGYGSAPTYFLSTLSLGVRPLGPGFARVLVSPTPGDLEWASGAVPTPRGPVSVAWARSSAPAFALSLGVPASTVAVVSLPRLPQDEVALDGRVIWKGAAVTPGDPRVRVLGASSGRVLLETQAGVYGLVSR